MATAAATLVTSGLTGEPSSGYRITGGSASDRLTIQDIVDALSSALTYDADTGLVTRVESSPTPYQFVFGGSSATASKNCFLELAGITFQLESEEGSDSTSLDRGNDTDKIIFDNQCDVIIGRDNGTEDLPDNGNVEINAENFSYNYFSYVPVLSRQVKIICNAYLIFACRQNSRVMLLNSNSESELRIIGAARDVSTFLEGSYARDLSMNLDIDVGSQELIFYMTQVVMRDFLAGGLEGNFLEIPFAITHGEAFSLYFNSLTNLNPIGKYTVAGIKEITRTDSTDAPLLNVVSTNTGGINIIVLERYGGRRGDAFFSFSARQHSMEVQIQQMVKVLISDPLGAALTADRLLVEAGRSTFLYSSSDNGTPTATETEYGEDYEYTDVEEQEIDVHVKSFYVNKGGNENTRTTSDNSVVSLDLAPSRYSVWLWGREIKYRVALTFPDQQGGQEVIVALAEDSLITAATKAAVPAAAATYDDVYDLLAEYAFDNKEEIAALISGTTLQFDDTNATLAPGGSMGRSGGTVTVPCAATLAPGTKIKQLKVLGDFTVNDGVSVTGPLEDSTGVTAVIQIRPGGGSEETVALFSSDGDTKLGEGTGDQDIQLTADESEDGLEGREC